MSFDGSCLGDLKSRVWPCCLVTQLYLTISLFAIPWTVAHQAPLSMGFPRQEYWSGLPFPSLRVWPKWSSNTGYQGNHFNWSKAIGLGLGGWWTVLRGAASIGELCLTTGWLWLRSLVKMRGDLTNMNLVLLDIHLMRFWDSLFFTYYLYI